MEGAASQKVLLAISSYYYVRHQVQVRGSPRFPESNSKGFHYLLALGYPGLGNYFHCNVRRLKYQGKKFVFSPDYCYHASCY